MPCLMSLTNFVPGGRAFGAPQLPAVSGVGSGEEPEPRMKPMLSGPADLALSPLVAQIGGCRVVAPGRGLRL